VTPLRCDGIFNNQFVIQSLLSRRMKTNCEIGQYLAKLWARVMSCFYLTSGVYIFCPIHCCGLAAGAKWWHSPGRLRLEGHVSASRNIVDTECVKTHHCSFRIATGVRLIQLDRLP